MQAGVHLPDYKRRSFLDFELHWPLETPALIGTWPISASVCSRLRLLVPLEENLTPCAFFTHHDSAPAVQCIYCMSYKKMQLTGPASASYWCVVFVLIYYLIVFPRVLARISLCYIVIKQGKVFHQHLFSSVWMASWNNSATAENNEAALVVAFLKIGPGSHHFTDTIILQSI